MLPKKNIKEYPYQNLLLANLPGEKWKPVTGFEDRYEVSSYGRIKSLPRERVLHHGGIQRMGEKIRKVHVGKQPNNRMNDLLYTLIITLKQDNKEYHYSVGRLVYNAFIAPFDIEDKSLYISYKDGDGRNLYYKNLFMTSLSEMRNHSYAIGRFRSHLSKAISQFTVDGKLIAQFDSMYQAEKMEGYDARAICSVVNGDCYLYKGFVWQLGRRKTLSKDLLPQKDETKRVNKNLMAKLGIKRDPDPLPAIFDLSLKSRSGERWKDIPGYEGLYMISNMGRVKALKKVSSGKAQHWYPEKIKCLTIEVHTEKPGKIRSSAPFVTLSKEHKKKIVQVARWVYYLFVEPFAIENSTMRIYCKDGNTLDVNYKNLELKNAAWSINRQLSV